MAEKDFERRLAAVMIADVVGYSRLIRLDEGQTRLALQGHRFAVIDPTIGQYQGRIVNFSGDSLLVEFPSATSAVECAIAIQNGIVERNAQVAEGKKVRFRIGINLGDVLIDGDQIFGDGINIAARLEALAEPDGVCISSAVYTQTNLLVEHAFTDLGAHNFKNIETPIRAYHHSGASAEPLQKSAFRPFVDLPIKKQTVETGGCMCGAVRYETSEPGLGTMFCHCRMCQKFSGAPILAGTTFRTKSVKFTSGAPKFYTSSAIAKRGFCEECVNSLNIEGWGSIGVKEWFLAEFEEFI